MVHKDIYAFTTTFLLFFFLIIALKMTPSDTLISHHNLAKQKISMDFITVKQLLCQVEPKVSIKKPVTKTIAKSLKKATQKSVKKEQTLKKIQTLKSAKKVIPVDKTVLEKEKSLQALKEKEHLKALAKIEKAQQKAAEQERVKQIASAQLTQERNVFLTSIKKRINENKSYPRIAKRRSIEGSTHIKFTIFKNGSIKIHTVKGDKIFYKKSKQALTDSFPVEIPSKIRSTFPLQLNINLHYALS